MRIGYDAKRIFHNRTGLGNYGRDVIRILNDHSSITEFCLFNTKASEMDKFTPSERTTIIYPLHWFWKWMPSLWRLFGQWNQISSLQLDAFHGLSGEIPIQFKKRSIPKIVTIHDLIFLSHPHYYNVWDRIIYRLKFKYAVKTADRVIAISEHTKSDIIKYFKIDPHKISVVYQGCNAAFKKEYSANEKATVRQKYELPENYIINVGTLQERKNVLPLLKAIRGSQYHLVLVGEAKKYASKLYAYVKKYQMDSQVTFLRKVPVRELAILYQNATVFCYPSICEGFGIPIIEALYSKIPVIVTQGGCFPEAAGPNSIYIDPNDPLDIRNQLNRVFEHPEEYQSLVEQGYTYAQRFSDEEVAKHLLEVYKKMI
ncbi:MAG: glycosyltransferase family 1 protein [Bacteroidota bacterium]